MSHIDYGLSILTPALFNGYPSGEPFDLAEILGSLSLSRQLAGYEVFERFYEIGSHQGLKECEEYFRLKDTQ
jgi:NDP-sugar pyrophosphorylase family protein